MTIACLTEKENRLAKAWYVKYPLDAYAIGPYRFDEMVPVTKAIEQAVSLFGEHPMEVWPDGETEECDEYEIELMDPESFADWKEGDEEEDEDDIDDDDDYEDVDFDDDEEDDPEDDDYDYEDSDDDFDDDDTDPWWDDED